MAVTENNFGELLDQLNSKSLEENYFKWTSEPIEALPSYTVAMGGTSHPSYGAVPNVTISGSTMSATGISVGSPVWTTTTNNTGAYIFANTQPNSAANIEQSGKMSLRGKNADLDINGKSLKGWMEKVEERLNILTPNPELEKEWDNLRRLGERYRKLEKKCQEKADMWKRLKSIPKPDII